MENKQLLFYQTKSSYYVFLEDNHLSVLGVAS